MKYREDDGSEVVVYTPNERQGGLIWGLLRGFEDISTSRHVIVQLFWRDFIYQFRQKIFGYLWALITPLLGVISFLYLYFMGVLRPGQGEMPYVLYVLIGSNIWSCLPGSLGAVSGGLQAQADLIMRTGIPKLALAVSSLATLAYSILVSMITTALIFLLCGTTPTWWFVLYPLLVLPMLLLGVAVGLVLAVLGSIARDLTPLVTQGLTLIMYVTPVIYVRSSIENSFAKAIIEWNPITYLVDVPRSLIFSGKAENLPAFLWVSLAIIGLVVVGVRVFYLLEDLVAERL